MLRTPPVQSHLHRSLTRKDNKRNHDGRNERERNEGESNVEEVKRDESVDPA